MPSKHSERLKQAIEYIRSGENEIAREIILEIIQEDPDYEKAWIWLVETVPDRENKIDILKTRLEQFPDTSPYSRIALDKIAPEVLDTLIPANEAIIYPPGMEPKSGATEDEIQYDVSIQEGVEDRFGFDDDQEMIQFEAPEGNSPLEDIDLSEEMQAFDEDDLFAEPSSQAPVEEDIDFNFFEDVEGEEVQEGDLDIFMRNEKDSSNLVSDIEEPLDFDAWLDNEAQEEQPETVDELADLLNEMAPLDEDGNVSQSAFEDDLLEDDEMPSATGTSDPFILDEDSIHIFGSEIQPPKPEPESLEDLFRGASTDDLTPTTGFLNDIELSEPDSLPVDEISQEDINLASDSFRENVMAEALSKSKSQQQVAAQEKEKQQEKTKKKKKESNATFIFGCSVMAAILFFSLIALGYLVLQHANSPQVKVVTFTPTMTQTITPTATTPAQAPWLENGEEEIEQTQTPTTTEEVEELDAGSDSPMLTQQDWAALLQEYDFLCDEVGQSEDSPSQICRYEDTHHSIITISSSNDETSPAKVEFQILSMTEEELLPGPEFDALLEDTITPLVLQAIAAEYRDSASEWLIEESKNLVDNSWEHQLTETFGETVIVLEYSYFLLIEL